MATVGLPASAGLLLLCYPFTASGLAVPSSSPSPATPTSTGTSTTPRAPNVCGARNLGGSDLVVSEACLGTMTYGVQNTHDDAFGQLDFALSKGINFVDTAELYPVPLFAESWRAGATEEIVGEYLESIGPARRDDLVIATKVAGYMRRSPVAAARFAPPLVGGPLPDCRLDAASVRLACEASLRRLRTDRIDLLQVHWPDRYVPLWGQTTFDRDRVRDDAVSIEETASALRDLIEEGKVRYIGLSNESPLGVCEWVRATEELGIRNRLVSIQNSYSLLDRRFDSDLAETCSHHGIGLLPFSVLAGGLLTGKYRDRSDGAPAASPSSRFAAYPRYMGRWSPSTASPRTLEAVDEYARIASDAGMTPAELAIAFVRSRRFVSSSAADATGGGSVIVGATTVEQLGENLAPFVTGDGGETVTLDEGVLEAIDRVHLKCRDPSCSL